MSQDPTKTAIMGATMSDRLLRLPSVEVMTGLKRTSIYARIKEDPPTFPAPIKLGKRASAWPESQIQKWISDRIESSRVQSLAHQTPPRDVKGTLLDWRERIAARCAGNDRLLFAVSCAFAGPLLHPSGIDSGGFHLRGSSSCGKTTALKVAGSVWGGPAYLQRWNSTANALEAIAAQHCDGLLILDELSQVDPRTAGECAYMLANETGKSRSTRTGQTRPSLTWRLLFLSAGEISLSQHMAEGGKRSKAGQELRLADIPADAGAGLGLFNELHDQDSGAALSSYLGKACEVQHGTAGRAFLEWAVVARVETLKDRAREGIEQLALAWIPELASGQVQRMGRRFALVAVAGELATEAGVTGWQPGEATRGVRECFHAWLASCGGVGDVDDGHMRERIQQGGK